MKDGAIPIQTPLEWIIDEQTIAIFKGVLFEHVDGPCVTFSSLSLTIERAHRGGV